MLALASRVNDATASERCDRQPLEPTEALDRDEAAATTAERSASDQPLQSLAYSSQRRKRALLLQEHLFYVANATSNRRPSSYKPAYLLPPSTHPTEASHTPAQPAHRTPPLPPPRPPPDLARPGLARDGTCY